MNAHPGPDQVLDHVLGLTADERVRVHVEACDECAALADRLEGERSVLAEGLSVPPPPALATRILDAVAAKAPRRRAWIARIPLAAAAALFLAVVATLLFRSSSAPGDLALEDGTRMTLAPGAEALAPGAGVVDLRRGSGTFRMPRDSKSLKIVTPIGTVTARGAEFSVELRPGPNTNKGGAAMAMESLLALVVSVMSGNVTVDAAGASTALTAGETHVFAAAQDNDDGEKGQKGKNEKGKQNDKDDGDKEDGKKKEKKGDKGEKEDGGKENKEKKKDKKEKDG